MMKGLLFALLSAAVVAVNALVRNGSCGSNVAYVLDSTAGTLVITGSGPMDGYGLTDMPWKSYMYDIKTITIGEGVTSVGRNSFWFASQLQSVSLPQSLTLIDSGAFEHCSKLSSITIPPLVAEIGTDAFSSCERLKSITLPESVAYLGSGAFANCHHLETLHIPANVQYIGNGLCQSCYKLKSFTVAEGNKNFTMDDGIIYDSDKKHLVACPTLRKGPVVIPDTVTYINGYAFYDCPYISSVSLPSTLSSIGNYAFYNSSLRILRYSGDSTITYSSYTFDKVTKFDRACVTSEYNSTHTNLCGYSRLFTMDQCEALDALENECYKVRTFYNKSYVVEQTSEARLWEKESTDCIQLWCDNATGLKSSSPCSDSNSSYGICLMDSECIDKMEIGKAFVVIVDIKDGVPPSYTAKSNMNYVSSSGKMNFYFWQYAIELNSEGNIKRVFFYVNDGKTANSIVSKVRSIMTDSSCYGTILCKATDVQIYRDKSVKIDSSAMNKAVSVVVMLMVVLVSLFKH